MFSKKEVRVDKDAQKREALGELSLIHPRVIRSERCGTCKHWAEVGDLSPTSPHAKYNLLYHDTAESYVEERRTLRRCCIDGPSRRKVTGGHLDMWEWEFCGEWKGKG